jgi:hypothetical protein
VKPIQRGVTGHLIMTQRPTKRLPTLGIRLYDDQLIVRAELRHDVTYGGPYRTKLCFQWCGCAELRANTKELSRFLDNLREI